MIVGSCSAVLLDLEPVVVAIWMVVVSKTSDVSPPPSVVIWLVGEMVVDGDAGVGLEKRGLFVSD